MTSTPSRNMTPWTSLGNWFSPFSRRQVLAADNTPDQPLHDRAALASTLLAGLELAREGSTTLDQDAPFGHILVAPVRHRAT